MAPLRLCEGLNGDILRRPTIRETQLFQAVEGDPSAEITLDARLTQLSVHEKNRQLEASRIPRVLNAVRWPRG
jgi:hypothetical protein